MKDHRLALKPGFRIGGYTIIEHIGSGGYGITYLAHCELPDAKGNNHVAIKELFPVSLVSRNQRNQSVEVMTGHEDDFELSKSLFQREANVLQQFQHPNIVNIFDEFPFNGTRFIVMEYIEGDNLEQHLKKSGATPKFILELLEKVIDTVDTIHKADYYHRDIAPDNILLDKSLNPVLVDFGSAKNELDLRAKNANTRVIKPGYSPFELYSSVGRNIGPWTDIYSIAAVFYKLITGDKPPDAPSRIRGDTAQSLATKSRDFPGFDKAVLEALDWGLTPFPEGRPQTISEWHRKIPFNRPKKLRRKFISFKSIDFKKFASKSFDRLKKTDLVDKSILCMIILLLLILAGLGLYIGFTPEIFEETANQ